MTPRQRDVLTSLGGLFVVACGIGPLPLLGRGYHTLGLILIGVMGCIGVLAFTYDRSNPWWGRGLAILAAVGLLSLIMQGYLSLLGVIIVTSCGIGALAFLYYDGQHVWSWWFPDEPFGPTVKRWFRYLLQASTVALAYVHARGSIGDFSSVSGGQNITQATAFGWSAGSEGDEVVVGNFRSP